MSRWRGAFFLLGKVWWGLWIAGSSAFGPGVLWAQRAGGFGQETADLRENSPSAKANPDVEAGSEASCRPSGPSGLESFLQSEPVRSDAQLNDVFFLDAQTGWAVGDRGTIWHTTDGGRHWQLQSSGVAARLLSVWFLDRQWGWVVGGRSLPYTGHSKGIVLRTQDGGRTWKPSTHQLLPILRRIRMVDAQAGFAVGESSALGPTGVWFTGDGGRTWEAMPGVQTSGWLWGDFFNPSTGALVGRLGSVGVVRRAELAPSRTSLLGRRSIWRVELIRPVEGWLVGQGGLLMRTDDAGLSWQAPPTLPPMEILRHFDLQALAVQGPNVWAAGAPGSRIFFSPDAGRTWQVFPTGQVLPIHALCFPDPQHGWAVGSLGTILTTEDGGQTWTRQRCGGTRAALLTIVGRAQAMPWEALAKWAGQEGFLAQAYLVGSSSAMASPEGFPASTETLLPDRVHEAVVCLGGAGVDCCWRFPLGSPLVDREGRHLAARWDEANDGRGLQALEAELVRQVRTWRPEVVLTHDASLRGEDPLGHLINQAVLQAVDLAADPTAYVDQLTQAGLAVWSAKRVFAFTAPGVEGDFQLPRSALTLRLGGSVADAADYARSLLVEIPGTSELSWHGKNKDGLPEGSAVGFRLLQSRFSPEPDTLKDLFERIVLPPGGEARRFLPELDMQTLADLQQQAQRRRHLEAIAQQGVQDARIGASLLAQTRQWVQSLDPDAAGPFLYHLGQRYLHHGQWSAAAEVWELLAQQQPGHPAAGPALVWLVQYYASMETAWRVHGMERRITPKVATPAWDQTLLEQRWERAAALARILEKYHPHLFVQPELRFPLAVADRARGYPKNAQQWFFLQRRSLTHDAWWACAQAEGWLDQPQGEPPKSLAFCMPAPQKPRLDGQLDDPCWRQAKPILLSGPPLTRKTSPADSPPETPPAAEVRLMYDTEYLYIGIRCPKVPGVEYPASQGPRPRDPDLRHQDRVEIFLDLDRDYTTYWQLAVDHRGWTGEACWGDPSWNPQWFVAAGTEGNSWTAEAAIGLDQLTGFFPRSNSVWTIGVQRIIPGVGIHRFPSGSDQPLAPGEFGLLIFQ